MPSLAIANIRPQAVLNLWQRESIAPMDALNLIDISNHDFYGLYGVLVMPLLKLIGSELLTTLELEQMIHGEAKFNHCLIARYQNHRRFLAMIANPYYLAINRAREAGVKYLELSFTRSGGLKNAGRLRDYQELVLLRLKSLSDQAKIMRSAGEHGLKMVYSSQRIADLDIFSEYKATNPNPLEYPVSVFFAAENPRNNLASQVNSWNGNLGKESLDYTLSLWKKAEMKEGFFSGILNKLVEG